MRHLLTILAVVFSFTAAANSAQAAPRRHGPHRPPAHHRTHRTPVRHHPVHRAAHVVVGPIHPAK